jgi:hypothetical protein
VQFMLDLAARVRGMEERLSRLEAQTRQDSRTSSKPPSMDPPKTRAERRAEARAKAKELMRREGGQRHAGGWGLVGDDRAATRCGRRAVPGLPVRRVYEKVFKNAS